MALPETRQRAGYLFLTAMVVHIVLISAQVNARSGVPVLEVITFGVFAEVQRAASAAVSSVRRAWSEYVALRVVREENEALRHQLAEARLALQEQQALAERSRGLERLLELRERADLATAAAGVIGSSAMPEFRTITLDKGTAHGLQRDMAVLSPVGVVGRIIVASRNAAKVQLLIDRNAAAGALVGRADSRAQGVVIGGGEAHLSLDYVADTADVAVGDTIVTSGIDGIYPKGFPIGRVEAVERSGGSYRRITVAPAVDFTTLEEVLVVLQAPPAVEALEPEQ